MNGSLFCRFFCRGRPHPVPSGGQGTRRIREDAFPDHWNPRVPQARPRWSPWVHPLHHPWDGGVHQKSLSPPGPGPAANGSLPSRALGAQPQAGDPDQPPMDGEAPQEEARGTQSRDQPRTDRCLPSSKPPNPQPENRIVPPGREGEPGGGSRYPATGPAANGSLPSRGLSTRTPNLGPNRQGMDGVGQAPGKRPGSPGKAQGSTVLPWSPQIPGESQPLPRFAPGRTGCALTMPTGGGPPIPSVRPAVERAQWL